MTPDLQRRLAQLGWLEIHQSDLSDLRHCRKYLRFRLLNPWQGTTLNAFLGTCFDRMLCAMAQGAARIDWPSILKQEWDACRGQVWDRKVRLDDWRSILPLVTRTHESGETLPSLGKMILLELEAANLEPIAFQTRLTHGPYTGTRDLLCLDLNRPVSERITTTRIPFSDWTDQHRKVYRQTKTFPIETRTEALLGAVLVDLKCYGLFNNWIYRESIQKQTWAEMDVTRLPQLRHYHWLSAQTEPQYDIREYAITSPTNGIPFVQGPEKGKRRGPLLFRAPAASLAGYEADLIETLESFVQSQPRDYPMDFGKPKCGKCRFRAPCLEGADVNVAALLEQGLED